MKRWQTDLRLKQPHELSWSSAKLKSDERLEIETNSILSQQVLNTYCFHRLILLYQSFGKRFNSPRRLRGSSPVTKQKPLLLFIKTW